MITTTQDLHAHLEIAIQVELSTIPPYLYAMYSLEDPNSEAALLIRSVVVEEMLHAALVANLLIGVGGTPDFRSNRYIPQFPQMLPHHSPPLEMALERASQRVIADRFLVIEQPEVKGAPPEDDDYETLGQFYQAVEIAISELDQRTDLFSQPRIECQMADPTWYGTVEYDAEDSGGLMAVSDLESAIAAIEIIVHQGEGLSDEKWADPAHQELTHYHKFRQIADGIVKLGNVRQLPRNPKRADMPENLQTVIDLFNAAYRMVYLTMAAMFEDRPDKETTVGVLYSMMAGVMPAISEYLTLQPIGDGLVAAPTFEVYEFASTNPVSEVQALASAAISQHPDLASVLGQLEKLNES